MILSSVVHYEHYCKSYIYWQASNTAAHYAFISSDRPPPPDLFPLTGGEPPGRHEELEVGGGGDDEDYEIEAPPPSDIDGCDWEGLSASFMT